MKLKVFTLIFSITSGILIIIAIFFPFVSTRFAGETHKYYLDGTVFIIEALGTIRYYYLIPGEFILILFTLTTIIFWIAAIILLINAGLIITLFLKKRQNNIFSILCSGVGCLVVVVILIVYFNFPFVGAGITLYPDLGFILSLIAGISAIGAGILDVILEKYTSYSK